MNAIEISRLTKAYQLNQNVVDKISFDIPAGSVFGFLGPNGSGKTTTVRLLNGILEPNAGTALVYGKNIVSEAIEIHKICGVMTETAALYNNLSGLENITFFGKMHGMPHGRIAERAEKLLRDFELWDARDKKVKTYSTGMKKKISLAIALLHQPKVLFLDEPTSGLDPEAAKNVSELIYRLATEEGATVFLCTHQLKYAEEICTLYGFLSSGKLLAFGTMDELLAQKEDSASLMIRGKNIPESLHAQKTDNDTYEIKIKDDADAEKTIRTIIQSGGHIYEARQQHMNLEDLYFAYQKDSKKSGGSL